MENCRDFLGKDLDDCISQAMDYYGCGRDNLEIEIVQEARSGIFGIVGARKAKIRARRAHVREKVASMLHVETLELGKKAARQNFPPRNKSGSVPLSAGVDAPVGEETKTRAEGHRFPSGKAQEGQRDGKGGKQTREVREEKSSAAHAKEQGHSGGEKLAGPEKGCKAEKAEKTESDDSPREGRDFSPEKLAKDDRHSRVARPDKWDKANKDNLDKREKAARAPRGAREDAPQESKGEVFPGEDALGDDASLESSSWPCRPLSELDGEALRAQGLEITRQILEPIAGRSLQMTMELAPRSARIHVDWEGDAGLLIGRDGQTLAAAQHLVSLILSRAMKSMVRVQLDIGNYRARQEDRLREMALSLAEKVFQLGKPLSTAPLSAYHRRLVHMCLQGNEDVQTRSIGDDPMKRVLISPRRSCQQ